jgi:monoamine oxidase
VIARAAIPALPAPNGKLRRTAWWRDPLSRGAYVNFRPGQLMRFAPLLTREAGRQSTASRSGNILFAGEWVSDEWPGYMNGAAQTGRIAADAVIADIRQSRTSRPSSIRR